MDFTPSPDQQQAIDRIVNWFLTCRRDVEYCTGAADTDSDRKCPQVPHTHVDAGLGPGPVISLGGYAGTGKTSVLGHLGMLLVDKGVKLVFATPTNKAAGVLRRKLPEELKPLVSTTYALSYIPDPKDKCKQSGYFVDEVSTECTCGEVAQDCTCPRLFTPCGQHDGTCTVVEHLEWIKRDTVRGHAELIVVDEASMLSQEQVEDLLDFGLPVLVTGDHGQLPPVMAQMNQWIARPDIVLVENHRQKQDTSGIVDLALWAREGFQLRKGVWGDGRTVVMGKDDPRGGQLLDPERFRARGPEATWPQIICALNADRAGINRIFHGPGPVRAGDKVTALRKCVVPVVERFDPEGRPVPRMRSVQVVEADGSVGVSGELEAVKRTVHNGASGIVLKAWEPKGGLVRIVVALDDGPMVEVSGCEEKQFGHERTLGKNEVVSRESRLWDYAYAVTCHRAQGSEWDEVIVMDNAGADRERWRYTAITRAKQKLIVISMRE